MRGYDFRSQKVGMILCIAKSFASMRDANQGMGRVGRCGESAQRFKLQSVALVDDAKNQILFSKMVQHIAVIQQQTNQQLKLGAALSLKKPSRKEQQTRVDYACQHIIEF